MLLRTGVDAIRTGAGALKAGQERIETPAASMSGTLSRLDGTSCEDHAASLAPRILRSQLNISRPRTVARRGQTLEIQSITLSDDNHPISDAGANHLQSSGLIVSAQDSGGAKVCVLAEISITVQQNDINRAAGRARVLEKTHGRLLIHSKSPEKAQPRFSNPKAPGSKIVTKPHG